MPARLVAVRAALAVYLAGLAWLVFAPAADARRVTGLVGWLAEGASRLGLDREMAFAALEFLANVALFLPFGALVLLAFRPGVVATTGLALGASIAIELVQLALPTRVSAVSDVIANTAGALAGAVIARAFVRRSRPARAPGPGPSRS